MSVVHGNSTNKKSNVIEHFSNHNNILTISIQLKQDF